MVVAAAAASRRYLRRATEVILTISRSEERAASRHQASQLRERPGAEITIDLPNQTVIAPDGNRHGFEISPLRKDRLVRGIDDIDVTLGYRDAIEAF
jgi:3-isopropylmalate/(R)-2-methylmalate dehydratase small subunit